MNELREQISMALGDAWSMDEDKAAAVDAVMGVVEALVPDDYSCNLVEYLRACDNTIKELEADRDRVEYHYDLRGCIIKSYESLTKKQQGETGEAREQAATLQQENEKLRERVDTLEAAQARYLMWYEVTKAERDGARIRVASLQARVKAYRRVWFDRRNWLGLTQIKLLMTEARVADLDALIANLDINDFCELCEAHRSLCLCYQSFAPEATQQPTAEDGEACPGCNDTGYRRERHAVRLQPCRHCESATDKPEPPVDGGEGA